VARPVARKKVLMVVDFMVNWECRIDSCGDDFGNVADRDDWRRVYIRVIEAAGEKTPLRFVVVQFFQARLEGV
jgi:hypothetical protein